MENKKISKKIASEQCLCSSSPKPTIILQVPVFPEKLSLLKTAKTSFIPSNSLLYYSNSFCGNIL